MMKIRSLSCLTVMWLSSCGMEVDQRTQPGPVEPDREELTFDLGKTQIIHVAPHDGLGLVSDLSSLTLFLDRRDLVGAKGSQRYRSFCNGAVSPDTIIGSVGCGTNPTEWLPLSAANVLQACTLDPRASVRALGPVELKCANGESMTISVGISKPPLCLSVGSAPCVFLGPQK